MHQCPTTHRITSSGEKDRPQMSIVLRLRNPDTEIREGLPYRLIY